MSESTPTPADVAPSVDAAHPKEAPVQLPEDHPLVTALAAQKAELRDLKEKARRLDEIEAESKTAEQKAAERLAAAEKRAAEIEARANRAEVAASTGVPVDILAGPKDSTPEAVAEFAALVRSHFERTDTQRKQHNNIAPREGTTPQPKSDEMREFTRNLFARAASD